MKLNKLYDYMKQIKKFSSTVIILFFTVLLSSCYDERGTSVIHEVIITDNYVNEFGHKVFIMSDSCMAEVVPDKEDVIFLNKDHSRFSSLSQDAKAVFRRWMNAEVGNKVVLKTSWGRLSLIFKSDTTLTGAWYDIQISPDYSIERKVSRITKYDGNLNKISGEARLRGGLLASPSGKAELKAEEMGSQKMFINIYFEDRAPITVNAQENQLWLDVEEGGIVIEKSINGKVIFTPKF